jgi:hypothetical protein
MHGGDTRRRASFVIEVELTFDADKVVAKFGSTQGVKNTQLLTTSDPVEAKVLRLFVRRPMGEGEFELSEVEGEKQIAEYLESGSLPK